MLRGPGRIGDMAPAKAEKWFQPHAVLEVEGSGNFQIGELATIGRAPDSHVVIPDRSVSRHHARIFYEGGHYWLKDLDSANGTKLNHSKIKLQMLSDSDKIVFGEVEARFCFDGTSGPAPIASDPLEGAEKAFEDGTPTGQLVGKYSAADELQIHHLEKELTAARQTITSDEQEIDRLRKLVKQLERALADSNLRLRNLQELLNQQKG
jgi:predicted component of type VI protein secretion system